MSTKFFEWYKIYHWCLILWWKSTTNKKYLESNKSMMESMLFEFFENIGKWNKDFVIFPSATVVAIILDFWKKIEDISLELVSFDVKSMFTNIYFHSELDIVNERWQEIKGFT
jgi:hypothetical protein